MHDELAEFYGAQPGSFEPRASTLDYVVGALAACLAGTLKRALLARGVQLKPDDLQTTATASIVVVDKVPTIRAVTVSYLLSNTDPADHEKIGRAHAVHHRACAVSRSLEAAIEISTNLRLE
jgi:organic hydroperoxide reductase OsmC/OhrA